MLYAVFLSILADMLSCPLALDGSRAANRSHTSDSVQRISSGQIGCREVTWSWMGGWDLLKQSVKNEFNRFALSTSEWAIYLVLQRECQNWRLALVQKFDSFPELFRILGIEQSSPIMTNWSPVKLVQECPKDQVLNCGRHGVASGMTSLNAMILMLSNTNTLVAMECS